MIMSFALSENLKRIFFECLSNWPFKKKITGELKIELVPFLEFLLLLYFLVQNDRGYKMLILGLKSGH